METLDGELPGWRTSPAEFKVLGETFVVTSWSYERGFPGVDLSRPTAPTPTREIIVAIITDAQVEHAMKCIQDWTAAKARAAHEYLDDYTKTLLAEIGSEAEDLRSQAAKDDFARRHPRFIAHLQQKRDAAELDYMHRQRVAASMAILDLYRTMSANERGLDRRIG